MVLGLVFRFKVRASSIVFNLLGFSIRVLGFSIRVWVRVSSSV